MPWLTRLMLLGALTLAPVLHARADEQEQQPELPSTAVPTDTESMRALVVRLSRIRQVAQQADSVRSAFEQAELALTRAREARAQSNEARAARAEQIAEAATTLAERRLALVRERDASRMARARLDEAHRAQGTAREALKASQKRAGEQP